MGLFAVLKYKIPRVYDPDGAPVSVTFDAPTAAHFTKLDIDTNTFLFNPRTIPDIGRHEIRVNITDNIGERNTSSFNLTVHTPPVFGIPLA